MPETLFTILSLSVGVNTVESDMLINNTNHGAYAPFSLDFRHGSWPFRSHLQSTRKPLRSSAV
jgi:hypothetical protein